MCLPCNQNMIFLQVSHLSDRNIHFPKESICVYWTTLPQVKKQFLNSCCETIFERKGSKTFSTLLYSCISFIWISFLRGEFRCLCVMYNFFKCLAIYTSSNAYKFSYKDSISGGFSSCSMHLPLDWMIVPLPSAL